MITIHTLEDYKSLEDKSALNNKFINNFSLNSDFQFIKNPNTPTDASNHISAILKKFGAIPIEFAEWIKFIGFQDIFWRYSKGLVPNSSTYSGCFSINPFLSTNSFRVKDAIPIINEEHGTIFYKPQNNKTSFYSYYDRAYYDFNIPFSEIIDIFLTARGAEGWYYIFSSYPHQIETDLRLPQIVEMFPTVNLFVK